jgi:hypothetical protein
MSTKHTPGPWVIGTRKDGSRWFSIGDPAKGPHYQSDIFCSDADARLIAAAPDLLEALSELERAVRILPPDMDEPDSPLAQARAAIAKALGADERAVA